MINFHVTQTNVFNNRFAKAEAILKTFCATLEMIKLSDPVLRAALDSTVFNLQKQVQVILRGPLSQTQAAIKPDESHKKSLQPQKQLKQKPHT